MGRPEFQVTEQHSREVKMLASVGCRQEEIAMVLDIAPKTLRKHFREELDKGAIQANAEVAQTLYRMATSGNNTAASIFWLKVRCGWRENAPAEEKRERKRPEISELPDFGVKQTEQSKREPLV